MRIAENLGRAASPVYSFNHQRNLKLHALPSIGPVKISKKISGNFLKRNYFAVKNDSAGQNAIGKQLF
jgi:hypothetical protein